MDNRSVKKNVQNIIDYQENENKNYNEYHTC